MGPAWAWAWDPRPWEQKPGTVTWRASGPRLGCVLGQKPGNVAGLPEKLESTMKMKSFCLCHNKSHQKPCAFEPRLETCIKNLMFLKVRTRNCVSGRSFQITKRSTSIGVSNSSKNDGARFAQPCPAVPCPARPCPVILVTDCRPEPPTLTRQSQDDGSSRQANKLPQTNKQ